jgi:hypothetical protein
VEALENARALAHLLPPLCRCRPGLEDSPEKGYKKDGKEMERDEKETRKDRGGQPVDQKSIRVQLIPLPCDIPQYTI